jgi:hypothetical protein
VEDVTRLNMSDLDGSCIGEILTVMEQPLLLGGDSFALLELLLNRKNRPVGLDIDRVLAA